MQTEPVKTDEHLRELIDYKDLSFPMETWTDAYHTFLDRTLNCHWHDSFEYGLVVEGSVDFYLDETRLRLEKGDSMFINSNVLHMARQAGSEEDAKMIGVGFPASLFPGGSVFYRYFHPVLKMPLQGFRIEAGDPHGKEVSWILKEICRLCDAGPGYELECLGLAIRLWLETLECISENSYEFVRKKAEHRHSDVIKEMISYIQEHFSDSISIQDLTEHAHVSRSECFRSFYRYTGKRPMEYINEYRLIQAAGLLKDTELSIAEIGSTCGFASSSYFGKLFREKYGLPPMSYRKESAAGMPGE